MLVKEEGMKRSWKFCLIVLLGILTVAAAGTSTAGQRRKRPRRTVVVHKGFPLHRPLRAVYVRPLPRPFRLQVRVFLPLTIWVGTPSPVIVERGLLVWEDSQTLQAEEDWTEVGFLCENTGTKLWLEVASGEARFDWAEVVFENGEAQVVEMKEFARGPGLFPLLDFPGVRSVDHVRMVVKAESEEARVVLKIQK